MAILNGNLVIVDSLSKAVGNYAMANQWEDPGAMDSVELV